MQRPVFLCVVLAAEALCVAAAAPSGRGRPCHMSKELRSQLESLNVRSGYQIETPNENNEQLLSCTSVLKAGIQELLSRHSENTRLLNLINATFTGLSNVLPAQSEESCDTDYVDTSEFIKKAKAFITEVQNTMRCP